MLDYRRNLNTSNFIMLRNNQNNSTSLELSLHISFIFINGGFYVFTFILGVIGNSAVCYIISCRMRQSATSMFLLNLSLADMMMALFCVPVTFISDCWLHRWIFGRILCHIFPFIQGVSVFLSALTHSAISVDRYFVVFHPLRRQNFPIKSAIFVIFCTWIFSGSASSPLPFFTQINKVKDREYCEEKWPNQNDEVTYSLVVMVLQYFLPVIVILLTYSAIAVRIWFYQTPGESIRSRDEAIATSKKKMIKMFIIVAIFYSSSQLPRHIINLTSILYYRQGNDTFWTPTTVAVMNITHLLSMSACFYNPLLYIWLNSSFRKSLTNMVTCHRSSSLPPTSPKCMNAFPDIQSSRLRKLSISSNNALLITKLNDRRYL